MILDIPPTPLVCLRVASKKACKGDCCGHKCVWEEAAGQGSTQRSYVGPEGPGRAIWEIEVVEDIAKG